MSISQRGLRTAVVLLVGTLIGFGLATAERDRVGTSAAAHAAEPPAKKTATLETLSADVEVLKEKIPDQSHAMSDVQFQFAMLWFAGQNQNWPLADFFYGETKSHLAWAVRIIPVRKDNAGRQVILKDILQALENSPLKDLGAAIKKKDKTAFEKAYRFTLEGCYACHKAVDKPYLHPQIPTAPPTTIINFDTKVDWPK